MSDHRTLYVTLTADAAGYRAAMRSSSDDTRKFGDDVDKAGHKTRGLSDEVNTLSGRLGLLVEAFLAVGPAAVPLSTAAVAGVGALTNQLGFAALGAGAVATALWGVGDAVSALSDYRDNPTAANLEKLRTEMEHLAPAAQEFVLHLQDARAEILQVQQATAQGFFPGAQEGLDQVLTTLPMLESLMGHLGSIAGDLAADTGEALAGDRVEEFVQFIERQARPNMQAAFETAKNLVGGLGEMWEAFAPLNTGFNDWMVDSSQKFDEWSQKLDGSEGFHKFVDYTQHTAPMVAETLGSIAVAAIEIGEAVAPLGGPALHILEGVADAVGAIADSPLGTPIAASAMAFTILNRSLSMTAGLMTKMGFSGPDGKPVTGSQAGVFGAISSGVKSSTPRLKEFGRDFGTVMYRIGQSADSASASTTKARESVRKFAREHLGAGVGLGAAAALSTGVADKFGATNTATLALAGSLMGPWGAAVGAAVGGAMDLTAGIRGMADATEDLDRVMSDKGASIESKIKSLTSTSKDFFKTSADDADVSGFRDFFDDAFSSTNSGGMVGFFSGAEEKTKAMRAEITASSQEFGNLLLVLEQVSTRTSGKDADFWGEWMKSGDVTATVTGNLGEIDSILRSMTPAMDHLGISVNDVMNPKNASGRDALVSQIIETMRYLDSSAGKTDAFTAALDGLDNEMLSTAESAGQFAAALDALTDPMMDQERALLAWKQSLADLSSDVNSSSKALSRNSQAGRQNRAAILDRVDALKTTLAADAAAGSSMAQLGGKLSNGRRAILDAAAAAGLNRQAVAEMIKQMGLTPELVETLIKVKGADTGKDQVEALGRSINSLRSRDLTIRTFFENVGKPGPPTTVGSTGKGALSDLLVGPMQPTKKSTDGNENGGLYSRGVRAFADGGIGAGGRYYSRVPQIVGGGANILWGEESTGWEAYISGKPSMRQRNVQILQQAAGRFGLGLQKFGAEPMSRGGIGPVRRGVEPARYGSEPASGRGAVVVHHHHYNGVPANATIRIDGQPIKATMEVTARRVVEQEAEASARAGATTDRMSWGG